MEEESPPGEHSVTVSSSTSTHVLKRYFRCDECKYVTDRKNNLKRHIATMHESCPKPLECCDRIFPNKASLRDHVIACHRNGYNCQICCRNFCRKALLKRHVTVHSGQKDYVCEVCGYATSHKSNLDRHKRRHLPKELRYQYLRSFPAIHSNPFMPTFSIPIPYKAMDPPFRTMPLPMSQNTISNMVDYRQENFKAAPETPSLDKSDFVTGQKAQGNLRETPGDSHNMHVKDRLLNNGGNSTVARPKIWNPAVNDNYRYTSTRCSSSIKHKLPTSDSNITRKGVKTQQNGRECKNLIDKGGNDTKEEFSSGFQPYFLQKKFVTNEKDNFFTSPEHLFGNCSGLMASGCASKYRNWYPHAATTDIQSKEKHSNVSNMARNSIKVPQPLKIPVVTGKLQRCGEKNHKFHDFDMTFQDRIKLTNHSAILHAPERDITRSQPIMLDMGMQCGPCRLF